MTAKEIINYMKTTTPLDLPNQAMERLIFFGITPKVYEEMKVKRTLCNNWFDEKMGKFFGEGL